MTDLSGTRLGSSTIVRRLGAGGMGDIYLAEQRDLGRQVAVKVIRLRRAGDEAALRAATARFIQEARSVAALEHPHILPIYEFGEFEDANYLVMQYIPTGSLADLMTAGTNPRFRLPLSPALVADLISQAASALQFAHDRHVMHLDVKPHNMLVRLLAAPTSDAATAEPHLLMADFGLARFVTGQAADGMASGTPQYAAPEQYYGQPVPASDQYALAGVAFQLLTGRTLFVGTSSELWQQHLNVAPTAASRINQRLALAVDAVLARALAKAPEQRYPTVQAFAKSLQSALVPAISAPPPPPRPARPSVLYPPVSVAVGGPSSPAPWPGDAPPPRWPGTADENAPTTAGQAISPNRGSAPPPAYTPGSGWSGGPGDPGRMPDGTPAFQSHPPPRQSFSREVLIVAIVVAIVILAVGGFLLYRKLNTTTIEYVNATTSSPCAQVAGFQHAGVVNAGADFSDVPFPSGTLGVAENTKTANGNTIQRIKLCAPGQTSDSIRQYYATTMPSQGWMQTSTFPANPDNNCGDAYCWIKSNRYVGLEIPTGEGTHGSVVTYDLRIIKPAA